MKEKRSKKIMKFNINKYEGIYAMHCKTEEEAKIFCRYLDSVGRRWVNGTSYMSRTNWSVYGPDTCYDFNGGSYCDKRYFLARSYYTILEFSDFEWDNKNTKRKPVIIYRNGQDVIALDKETGEKAVAKCHPNDEFDFAIGAKIAFGRLYHSQDYIPEGNKAKCKPEFQIGDRVRCIKKDCEIGGINIVNELGVIRETGDGSALVEFDNNIGGHSGGGKGKAAAWALERVECGRNDGYIVDTEYGEVTFGRLLKELEDEECIDITMFNGYQENWDVSYDIIVQKAVVEQ